MRTKLSRHGFAHVLALLVIAVLAVGVLAYSVAVHKFQGSSNSASNRVTWQYTGLGWKSSRQPPSCPSPILQESPVNVRTATAILYPGQTRGQYKAHGGFQFRNNSSNEVVVRMPIDGYITSAARYLETTDTGTDELQYLATFQNDCGISIKFDHLLSPSPELQAIMDKQPKAKLNNTSSLPLRDGRLFKKGEIVATAIGTKSNQNVAMDFGVYDYRKKNLAAQDSTYAANHSSTAYEDLYAICWLNELPTEDSSLARSLPGGDMQMGKTSDYCK